MGVTNDVVRILLVEDSEDDAFFLARALKTQNRFVVIHHAKDGEEAVAYLSGTGRFADRTHYPFPDIMILDLKMPNRNGFEVLESIQGKSPRPRIVVYTSSDDPLEVNRAFALGCDAFQTKSADAHKLASFIDSLGWLAGRQ